MGRTLQTPYIAFISQKNHSDELILKVQGYLEENFKSAFSIDDISNEYGLSRRTLERRFKTATGDSPIVYLQRIRVEAAKGILKQTISPLRKLRGKQAMRKRVLSEKCSKSILA